jgi:uncharacterized cupredoxin-like copper-binding protein
MTPMLVSMAALLVLVLAGVTTPDWSRAQAVTVVATEYRSTPNRIAFRVGAPSRLHLENHGQKLHEFTAPDFFQTVDLAPSSALNPERGEVVLQPGAQADLYLVPRQAGQYPFTCADHDWAGMTGAIRVEPDG